MRSVTVNINDTDYEMIATAAQSERRDVSNFIEYATLQYLTSSQFVDKEEMDEILSDKELVNNLKSAKRDLETGSYLVDKEKVVVLIADFRKRDKAYKK